EPRPDLHDAGSHRRGDRPAGGDSLEARPVIPPRGSGPTHSGRHSGAIRGFEATCGVGGSLHWLLPGRRNTQSSGSSTTPVVVRSSRRSHLCVGRLSHRTNVVSPPGPEMRRSSGIVNGPAPDVCVMVTTVMLSVPWAGGAHVRTYAGSDAP